MEKIEVVYHSVAQSMAELELHEAMTSMVLTAEWLARHHAVPLEGVAAMFVAGVQSVQGFLGRELH
jgi:hypothetical protein